MTNKESTIQTFLLSEIKKEILKELKQYINEQIEIHCMDCINFNKRIKTRKESK